MLNEKYRLLVDIIWLLIENRGGVANVMINSSSNQQK